MMDDKSGWYRIVTACKEYTIACANDDLRHYGNQAWQSDECVVLNAVEVKG